MALDISIAVEQACGVESCHQSSRRFMLIHTYIYFQPRAAAGLMTRELLQYMLLGSATILVRNSRDNCRPVVACIATYINHAALATRNHGTNRS
jgi:hypothetical protein